MRAFAITAALLLFALSAGAQTAATITAEMRTAANDAYQKQDWPAAAAAYKTIATAEPKNAGALYRLGISLLNMGKTNEAQARFEAAMSISPNSVFALAQARAHSRAGEKDKVYALFERSLTLGGISAEVLNDEKDFSPIKGEAKFAEFVRKLDALANPCRARPEFRQFDFWIGEWLPQNAQGLTVGTSSIQLILKDCVIFENWNTPASSGKSFSLFDAKTGKWRQTWVDGTGNITHYTGGLEDGKMMLVAEVENSGKRSLMRMTYTKLADGGVRQHGENSTDGGKTWTTAYDFKYVRAK